MIEIRNLKKYFPIKGGFFNKQYGEVKAVENVSFKIPEGEILGLVGESGSGKTTLGRSIIRLIEPSNGKIFYNNKNIIKFKEKEMRELRKDFQIIFQDPFASLDPRKKVFDIISQGLKIHTKMNKEEIYEKVKTIINDVGLQEEHLKRYPHEFSGGQRQRIGIARALVLDPKFIIADEPVSALDVTIQAQILNLILELKEKYSLTILFISHDLSVINQIADRVMVMYLGHMVEIASTKKLFSNPRHPYTRSLIETAPQIFRKDKKKIILKGDIPSPINPPSGCVFRTRCPNPSHDCKHGNIEMGLIEVSPEHWVDQCCVNCN
ncbi:MAG: Oligopeptide transport ATP-binding protein OppF [Alphaproteobacteria bacterium MarineAlpha5_Bin12]|nr:MAG: Oligopeptide transport ATP-binding protein OppF [Alphaproteobacteria bacterium MarineAlpha5_Bin12]|tara:strand:+ start:2656 stop:3621 length:966 start_codon:yes stop_codon:yes gene_type:complete